MRFHLARQKSYSEFKRAAEGVDTPITVAELLRSTATGALPTELAQAAGRTCLRTVLRSADVDALRIHLSFNEVPVKLPNPVWQLLCFFLVPTQWLMSLQS